MNGFEKLRDILYDSIDYVFMLAIIVVVALVIGWRLDVLFAKDALEIPPSTVIVDNSDRPQDGEEEPSEDPGTETPGDPSGEQPQEEPSTAPAAEPQPTQPPPSPQTQSVKIIIPEGSLPGKIGLILEENGVVASSRDFLAKVVEMKLDTKLKSGTFTIQKGLSIEEVVKIITK